MKRVRWVVAADPGVYLVSEKKALEGAGEEGGAFTRDLRFAKKYKSPNTARAVARRLYQCRTERVER